VDDASSVVLANNRAFSAMDVDAMLAFYASDAVVVDRRRVATGTFTGHEELRAFYSSIFHSASELREDIRIVAERDGLVVADCELCGQLATDPTGPTVTIVYGLLVRVEDGLIRHLDITEDGDHALEISGLS